jgi:hypothetical protein
MRWPVLKPDGIGQSLGLTPGAISMNHFTLGDWVDFAQDLKTRAVRAEMQRHLDEGCRQCLRVVRMWRNLVAFASGERSCHPPERALRFVRGVFGLSKPARQGIRVPAMAHLLFDSSAQAVVAGVRSSHSAPRQLVYSVGKLFIDLRIEWRLGHVFVVGQAQQHSSRDPGLGGRDVLVLQGTKTIARTTSNQFGEFQFTLESEENPEFSIVVKGPTSLVVPVRDIPLAQEEPSE